MRIALFLLANAALFIAWSVWLARAHAVRGSANAVYAGLLFASQLVSTQLLLGAVGWLRLPVLLGALFVVSAVLLLSSVRRRASSPYPRPFAQALAGPANIMLACLAMVAMSWIVVAAWLLPPRGVDDLAYHLPPLYQYASTGQIGLLPLELRKQFGMPMGGDFLYLWPMIFFHSDTWVDAVALGVAVYCAVAVYALARALDASPRDAFFSGILLLLMPVVMAQSGASYTDLAITGCHTALLYAAVRAWQDGRRLHLVMAGLASGFGVGVKYNMLVAIAAVLPTLALGLWRRGGLPELVRGGLLFVVSSLPLPAYWLVRNVLVLGEPLYPYTLGFTGLRPLGMTPLEVEQGAVIAGSALAQLFIEPVRLVSYLFRDPGLGTLNGGFGIVFWGLSLPALAWCAGRAVAAARRRDWLPLLIWATPPFVFLVFLQQTDLTRLPYNMRLVMAVPALGLVALAVAIGRLREDLPAAAASVRAAAVGVSLVAVAHLAGGQLPGFDISSAVADRRAGTVTTPQRYYRDAHGDLPSLATAFEPLDWLTLEGRGWDVYMAADWRVFVTAPLFGSNLQNRVWNFLPDPREPPDALVFHTGFSGGTNKLFFLRGRITPAEAAGSPELELLVRSPPTELWVATAHMNDPETRARLAAYYEKRYPADIAAFAAVLGTLPPADVILGASDAVHALRYHELVGALDVPVHLVPSGNEEAVSRRAGARRVISVGAPVSGAATRLLTAVNRVSGPVNIYYNELSHE